MDEFSDEGMEMEYVEEYIIFLYECDYCGAQKELYPHEPVPYCHCGKWKEK